MNLYKALRLVALRDVLLEPADYHLRYIQRWYSRTFHVPLPQVADLDLEHVLQAFYESRYEDMDEEEREKERKQLIESDEARQKRMLEEDRGSADDDLWAQQYEEEIRAAQAEEDAKLTAQKKVEVPIVRELPEAHLVSPEATPKVAPPNISLSFVNDDEFERLIDEADSAGTDDDPRDGNLPLKPLPDPTR